MKPWNHGGACETNPPALRLAANCWGKSGFRSFSIAPFSQTAPTRILTHAMPFISPGLLPEGTGPPYSTHTTEARRIEPMVSRINSAAAKRTAKIAKEDVLAEKRFSRGRFIKFGAALGVGASASMAAACGGGEKAEEEGPTAGEGAVKGASESTEAGGANDGVAQVERGAAIAQESDVPQGSAVEFTDEETGQQAVLVHLEGGDFAAYSA